MTAPAARGPRTARELQSLRASLDGLFRAETRAAGVTPDLVRKRYVFALFLRRLFPDAPAPGGGAAVSSWMLLGANALLIRTGTGRFTQDIDLARDEDWTDPDTLRDELQGLLDARAALDPFTITVTRVRPHSDTDAYGYGAKTAKAHVRVLLGGREFDTFTIDITTRRHITTPVDHVQLAAPVPHPTLADHLPLVPTLPIENHLVDKICALYETHRSGASTRYRDLADIVRIITDLSFDAARVHALLDHESQRRRIPRPQAITAPSPAWASDYPRAAATFAQFPTHLHALDASLAVAGDCLDDILAGHRTTGTWQPTTQQWT